MIIEHDIVVVGGGPIGLLFSLMYSKSNKYIVIIDTLSINENDGRIIALSYSSINILKKLNLWDESKATYIDKIHISHSGLGVSKILKDDLDIEHLGCTIKYYDLYLTLFNRVKGISNIKIINAEVTDVKSFTEHSLVKYSLNNENFSIKSNLTVIADGGKLRIDNFLYKEYDYKHEAIITEIYTNNYHENIAYERFDKNGTFVLLPYDNKYTLIWSRKNQLNKNFDVETLLDDNFFKRFGNFSLSSKVYKFPLKYRIAKNKVSNKIVLIGNAAQTINPISAQGMNLAFRDANDLNNVLISNKGFDLYINKRAVDTKFITNFTHFLARFLYSDIFLKKNIITLGLISISNLKFMQNKLFKYLIFGIIENYHDKKI